MERRAQLARVEVHRTGFSLQQRGWEGGQGWVPWPLTEESASWEGAGLSSDVPWLVAQSLT